MPAKKWSKLVPFLFGRGHWKGGWGVGSLRSVHPKKYTCRPKKKTLLLKLKLFVPYQFDASLLLSFPTEYYDFNM